MIKSWPVSQPIPIGKPRTLTADFAEQGIDCARNPGFPPINLWSITNGNNGETEEHDLQNTLPGSPHESLPFNSTMTDTENPFSNYERDWIRLFEPVVVTDDDDDDPARDDTNISVDVLRKLALNAHLRTCCFRSICWRVYLGILPLDIGLWYGSLRAQRRQFQQINESANDDPRSANGQDHPLALENFSRWNHFFQMREIKRLIVQDVDRTFPHIQYFRAPEVQQLMVNILVCYNEATGFGYQQGMHEVLAPICFVLHWDSIGYQRVCEQNLISTPLRRRLATVFDPRHLQADAFTIFFRIMATIQTWYTYGSYPPTPSLSHPKSTELPSLFVSTQSPTTNFNPAVAFLDDIHNRLLKNLDQKLHFHLKSLDIHPALFGLRWIRLLFGHEFDLYDLLYVWDCIFALDNNFVFVRYMYVSMLQYLSPMLLSGDYSDCLFLLMRYPTDVDVTHIIQTALHLYNPSIYPATCLPNSTVPSQITTSRTNSKVGRKPFLTKLTPKKTSKSVGRHKALQEASNLGALFGNSRSAVNLNSFSWNGSTGREWLSEQATPNLDSPQTSNTPILTHRSIASMASNPVDTEQDRMNRIYRQCVQALESCSAHVDVLLCRSLDEVNTVGQNKHSSNCAPYMDGPNAECERLHLLKCEIRRVQEMLDALMLQVGNGTQSPLVQRKLHQADIVKNSSRTPSRLVTYQVGPAPISSQPGSNQQNENSYQPEQVNEEPPQRNGYNTASADRLGKPGSLVRLQLFRKKGHSSSSKLGSQTVGCRRRSRIITNGLEKFAYI